MTLAVEIVAAVAAYEMPRTGLVIVRPPSVTLVAAASTTRPYQLPDAVPVIVTGCSAVPLTVSVPRTTSSTRPVSRPAAWPSVDANCTVVPASIVRNAPVGTIASPCTMYGLPAGVQVWLMMLPPATIVSAAAPPAVAAIRASVSKATRQRMRSSRGARMLPARLGRWRGCAAGGAPGHPGANSSYRRVSRPPEAKR